jgi:hypothetical protein|tara:strand:- start:1158 stop:1415 length:258 start_codon:yes stop_codon:yes gene_type:complete
MTKTTDRKKVRSDHKLANSWLKAGEKHTENYEQFKKDLAPIINDITKDGINTLQGIADELTRRKVTTRSGKTKWYASQIRNYWEK